MMDYSFLLIVDDFIRYSWLFPLQHKSQVFDTFFKFKSLVENLYSASIKSVQTDEGCEFLNRQFTNFYAASYIQHRLSCPYTLEQMRTIERKHCHLVETELALLAAS